MHRTSVAFAKSWLVLVLLAGPAGTASAAQSPSDATPANQPPDPVAAAIEALRDRQPSVRRKAAHLLGDLKDRRGVPALVVALGDNDANVRFYAAYALGEIKDLAASPALLASLRDREWNVRDQAAWALREIGDRQITPNVAALLAEPQADLAHLVWLLRQLEGPASASRLLPLLDAPDPQRRLVALRAVVEMETPAAMDHLLRSLSDPSPLVRRAACAGLLERPRLDDEAADSRIEKGLAALLVGEKDPAVRVAGKQLQQRLRRAFGLLAHWSFDDGDPKIARDSVDDSHGEIHECQPAEGKCGLGLRLPGKGGVLLGKPPKLPMAERPFTVMAWVKATAPDGVVIARGGAFCGFSLHLKDGRARFGICREKGGPQSIAAGTENLVGQWHHLAGVVQTDRVELFIDRRRVAIASTAGYLPNNAGQGMEIGCDLGTSPVGITDRFQGCLDEVKMFGEALSEEKIRRAQ